VAASKTPAKKVKPATVMAKKDKTAAKAKAKKKKPGVQPSGSRAAGG
jgi:hypothetical protein